jgi:hypothetical protein
MEWSAPEARRRRRLGERFRVGEKIWHLIAVHKSHPAATGRIAVKSAQNLSEQGDRSKYGAMGRSRFSFAAGASGPLRVIERRASASAARRE